MADLERAQINGFEMAYVDEGQGPPILFVHAFPLDHSMWSEQIEAFKDSNRVIAPDLRGFGQSEVTPGPYTMDLLADDLASLLNHLGLDDVVYCGLSLGGYIGFPFWWRHTAMLRALVLADTRATTDSPVVRQGRETMIQKARTDGVAAATEGQFARMMAPGNYERLPDVASRIRAPMNATDPRTIVATQQGMLAREDWQDKLSTIMLPTLIVVGDQDGMTPPEEARLMHSLIPDAHLAIIPAAGHMSNMEEPARFNLALADFLASLPR
jgi:3-oxoadipate enol-lactonase